MEAHRIDYDRTGDAASPANLPCRNADERRPATHLNREPCFFAEEGYPCDVRWLEETARDCGYAIRAYAMMTSHVHLLLTLTVSGAPARLMQSLGRRYVQYANCPYRRTGSLREGRYESSVVQAESCRVACMRYIDLNPARAGIVADPSGYRWSSYQTKALAQPDARLTPHPLDLGLDADAPRRCKSYRVLFRPRHDEDAAGDVREALRLSITLGRERFAEAVCTRLGIRRNTGRRGRAPGNERETPMVLTEQQGLEF